MKVAKRRGYTLLEIIIVMAIIGLLAGTIYASTGGVREKARQKSCLSNLR